MLMAERVPVEHGQTTIFAGAAEPEATGENHSSIHLENMLKLSQMGATIMPAAPGFYHNPKTIDDLVDFVVARILDHLGIEQSLVARWGYQSSKHSED